MPIVSHSVARGSVLGVHRYSQTVDNAATGDVYIPLFGKFRIVAMAIVPLVDQSSFTGVTAELFAPDGTTSLTQAVEIDVAAGVQASSPGVAPDNNLVDCETEPLVLTVTNAGSDTLKFQVLVLYSTPLSSDAGQYVDYILNVNGAPIL
jgi:hypothetical protein